jgi:hypothetical protein
MRRLRQTSCLLGLLAAAACAGAKAGGPNRLSSEEMQGVEERKQGDLTVKIYDLNHTGADVWDYSKTVTDPKTGKSGLLLVRKEMDLNGDGKVDLWRWYRDDGSVEKEALDLDFDGKVDEVIFFDAKGQPVKKEQALNFDGKPNLWKYYERGQLVRKERDTKGTGRVDTWEYWEGGKIDRIGIDTDGDGIVDQWIKSPSGS